MGDPVPVSVSTSIVPKVRVAAANRPPMVWVDRGVIYALAGASAQRFVPNVNNALNIAVDASGGKIYWTAQTGESSGTINAANLNGSEARELASILAAPRGIAVDGARSKRYWTNVRGRVQSANLNGSGIKTVVDGLASPGEIVISSSITEPLAAGAPTVSVRLKRNRSQEQNPLQHRLMTETYPGKTQLFANYPNPFNPETWIPYELATGTDVKITIYNPQGVVVRTLALGHQSAGYYTGRERAVYWDGRNALGEPVASGVYVYQLETDDMSALRKMVILK